VNWPIFLFYAFLFVSLFWANSYFVSFKRWGKEFGNIAVLLVILTEARPGEAVRAVFVRCAYLWLPLSVVLIRYFPSIGRYYSLHGGEGELTGVTTQKNSLGELVLVCGLVLLWDWLEFHKATLPSKAKRIENWIYLGFFFLTAYLMHLCNSATSLLCLLVSASIIAATRLPLFRKRRGLLGVATLAFFVSFWVLDKTVGVKENVVEGLGRDMTYTHRTDIWGELLDLHTDPILGVGFMSFWDDDRYQSRLPEWAQRTSAHNGYLEEYLAGGWVGIFFVIVMLLGTGFRINGALRHDGDYGAVRLAIFVAFVMHNFAESNIAGMTFLGFIFLLTGIGHAQSAYPSNMLTEDAFDPDDFHSAGEEVEPAAVLTCDY
jgi:O-antigen ligase